MSFILAVLLSGSTAFAQIVGDDLPYSVLEAGNYRFIYSSEYKDLAIELAEKNQFYTTLYENEFDWKLDEDVVLALASSKNQITNGFATQFPRMWTLFYNGGPGAIDDFGMISWSETLMAHESVHLYQLNTRRGLGSAMKKVLGGPANPLGFQIPFTYIITPHVFTPTFMIEGNATFNENRFGNGGRLYSSYYRALFLQLLKHDKLTASRIINSHIDFPFGTEKYIVGGYFNAYLANEFSEKRVNRYFYVHTAYYLWPFLMNDSFKDNFGKDFYSLWEDFKNYYKPLADQQTELDTPALSISLSHEGFTVNGDVIAFIVDDDAQGPRELCLFHKKQKQLKCEKSFLPMGRVFRHNKEWVAAASLSTHPTEIRAGLFQDGYKRLDEFNDQYVFAKKGPHIVYADAKNSFKETQVLKNGQQLGVMHSSPHLDVEGNVYYFKQEGPRRILFKNNRRLFSIKGYYGRVVDVSRSGKVYFTGSTRSGVGLFSYDGVQMYQELDSDRLVDAKLIDGNEFFVAEITSEGFETRMAKPQAQVDEPVLYDYDFKQLEVTRNPVPEDATTYDYSPLFEMEYNGATPVIGFDEDSEMFWLLGLQFNDPLQRYDSRLILGDEGYSSYSAQWLFTSYVNRLQWTFSALYDEDPVFINNSYAGRYAEIDFDFRFLYPLINTPLWKSSVSLGYAYDTLDLVDDPDDVLLTPNQKDNALIFKYNFSYGFQNGLDYDPSRFVGLELGYKFQGEGSSWEHQTPSYTGELGFKWDILWQSFLSSSYKYGKSDGPLRGLELDDEPRGVGDFDPTVFFRLEDDLVGFAFELAKVNAEFKQVIPVKQYFARVPIGIHRVAGFYGYSEFYSGSTTLFHESYYGAEAELLIFHKFPMRVSAIEVESSLGLKSTEYRLGSGLEF